MEILRAIEKRYLFSSPYCDIYKIPADKTNMEKLVAVSPSSLSLIGDTVFLYIDGTARTYLKLEAGDYLVHNPPTLNGEWIDKHKTFRVLVSGEVAPYVKSHRLMEIGKPQNTDIPCAVRYGFNLELLSARVLKYEPDVTLDLFNPPADHTPHTYMSGLREFIGGQLWIVDQLLDNPRLYTVLINPRNLHKVIIKYDLDRCVEVTTGEYLVMSPVINKTGEITRYVPECWRERAFLKSYTFDVPQV
ncbi:MAG: hypothetical protein LBP59_10745 [Planctomycetaceae bacterium]|nr:hypothetical protein [Planctomycetaceae bacterium]